jgi:hypothetical protein
MWITRRRRGAVPYARLVHWDRLFEDLEGQLAGEWEAERAALDAETERLRIAKLTLRTRLRVLHQSGAPLTLYTAGDERSTGRIGALGADWLALDTADARSALIVPLHAVASVETHHGAILETLDDRAVSSDGLRERMTLGFLLRDFARRRLPLRIALTDGETVHGTIDRAGEDHLDLAMHDAGDARHAHAVRAFRLIPFTAMRWLRTSSTPL